MKINQRKMGALLSFAQMALGVLVGLIYTPLMIRLLGKSEYGLYNTVGSTISMLSILNLGFNSSYIRFYSEYKRKRDEKGIRCLNGLFLLIFMGISLIALVCGLYLTKHLELVFSSGLTQKEYVTARILTLLLTFNLTLSFPMSVFSSIISAQEHFVFLKLLGIGKTVISPLVTLPLLLAGYRSVGMVVVTLIISTIVDVTYVYYAVVRLKTRFSFRGFEKKLLPQLLWFTSFIAINLLVDQINLNVDKVLLGRFKGTDEVAVYSVGYTLYNYYMMLSTSVSGVFTPKVHRLIRETEAKPYEQRKVLTELFTRVGRIQFLILALVASGFVFYGQTFIVQIWAGPEYNRAFYVALLLMIPASIALIQNIGIEIQRAQNKHWFRSVAYLAMAFVNIILSIYLCQRYGAVGSALGTAISFIVANGIIMNIYYHKACNMDVNAFWRSILKLSRGLIIPCIYGIITRYVFDVKKLEQLLIAIVTYSVIYLASMWGVGMNVEEKQLIKKPLMKVLKKIK